jgi:2-polyprenyl-6-methoxyphenol hydroxylase-like FAD-dependent oxidoreductase
LTEHEVVIAGGGPTGMMLAAELALAGVDVVVVERRETSELAGSRAGGLHARTIEVFDQRGVAERFLSEGQVMQTHGYAYIPLDISDFPTRHPYGLALKQNRIEPIMAEWVAELGVPTLRRREVVAFGWDDDGVDVELSDGETLRAAYLVGCDGGRSLVRKTAGIEFPGWDATSSWIIAEVQMAEEPVVGVRREGGGIGPIDFQKGGNPYGVVLKEREVEPTGEPDLEVVRDLLVAAYGTDFGVHSPTWISRFSDACRQTATYRTGRVLVAGDAAHIHSPHGGQGLNTGVQDAVNLGWKLAQVVQGRSADALLDTYHAERHPVGAQVLRNTMAMVALTTPDDRHDVLRETMTQLLHMDEPRRYLAGMLSGLSIHYDLGEGHPLVGWRMPDLDLQTTDGPTRVFALLHAARPLLVHSEGNTWRNPPGIAFERVRVVEASTEGPWEVLVAGPVPVPAAVLVRPDGHVAWAGELDDPALATAAQTWFG